MHNYFQIDATCTGALRYWWWSLCCWSITDFATDLINTDLPDIPIDGFADTFANATAYSTAGLSDYSDNFDLFLSLNVGAGVSAAAGEDGGLESLGETGAGGCSYAFTNSWFKYGYASS
jgi:hypothetical protein